MLAKKIANLRVFSDENDKMNLPILDIKGEAIVVSQFTLMADTHKGNRPSFIYAAPPDIASPLVDHFVEALSQHGVSTQTGEFGADMLVEIHNDGPVTILLET
jgi:D-tyrosyl-tRNA(Tyr) deacylase